MVKLKTFGTSEWTISWMSSTNEKNSYWTSCCVSGKTTQNDEGEDSRPGRSPESSIDTVEHFILLGLLCIWAERDQTHCRLCYGQSKGLWGRHGSSLRWIHNASDKLRLLLSAPSVTCFCILLNKYWIRSFVCSSLETCFFYTHREKNGQFDSIYEDV